MSRCARSRHKIFLRLLELLDNRFLLFLLRFTLRILCRPGDYLGRGRQLLLYYQFHLFLSNRFCFDKVHLHVLEVVILKVLLSFFERLTIFIGFLSHGYFGL